MAMPSRAAAVAALASRGYGPAFAAAYAPPDYRSALGRFMVTRDAADIGAFRSSPLRNVGLTAPYMHGGSLATLWDAIDFYNNGGVLHPQLDKAMQPLDLGADEIDQLV